MGYCACKQVTQHFCFHHLEHVCELCVTRPVSACGGPGGEGLKPHLTCVVRYYMDWLTSSDYVAACSLCAGDLTPSKDPETDAQSLVRLSCFDLFHRDCLVGYLAQKSGVAAGHPHARPEQLAQHMQLKDIENVPCPSCVKPVLPAPGNLGPLASRLRAFFEETFRPMAGSQFSSQSTVDLSAPGGGPASGGGNTIGPGPITPGGGTYQSHLPGGMPGVSHPGGPAPGPEAAGLYIPPAVATAPAPGDVYIPMRSRSIADDDDKDKYRSKSSLKGRSPMLRAGAFSPSRRARRLMLSFVLMATIMLLLYYVIQSSDRGTGPGVPPGGAPVPAAGAAAAAGAPY